jgi:hypothetical protein
MWLMGIQHAIHHGTACFHVEDLRELLGIVAGDDNFAALHFMKDVLPGEQLLGEPRPGERNKGVKLRLALALLFGAAGHYDPAGTDIQSNTLFIFLHDFFSHFAGGAALLERVKFLAAHAVGIQTEPYHLVAPEGTLLPPQPQTQEQQRGGRDANAGDHYLAPAAVSTPQRASTAV